jgi:hypothetical protein
MGIRSEWCDHLVIMVCEPDWTGRFDSHDEKERPAETV